MSACGTPLSFASGAYGRAVFGESYQIAGQNEYDTDFYRTSGLASDASDFVGGLYVQSASFVGFSAQSRFDDAELRHQAHRSCLLGARRAGAVKVNYADVTGEPGLADGEPREEIVTAGTLAITELWSVLGNFRYDLETAKPSRTALASATRMTVSGST